VLCIFARVGVNKFNDLHEPIAGSSASLHIDIHTYIWYINTHSQTVKYCKVNDVIPILYMSKLRLRELK